MEKPKPDTLKFLLRFATGLIILMILFSLWHYCWYRYHILTDLVTQSRCETKTAQCEKEEVELRLDLSKLYHQKELKEAREKGFELQPIEKPKSKDGVK